jgi:hypothetical protein
VTDTHAAVNATSVSSRPTTSLSLPSALRKEEVLLLLPQGRELLRKLSIRVRMLKSLLLRRELVRHQ